MGRSQVLYNRTKGRYKTRSRAGSSNTAAHGEAPDPESAIDHGRPNPLNSKSQSKVQPRRIPYPSPQPQPNNHRNRRSKLDESVLLLDPASSLRYQTYKRPNTEEEGTLLFGNGSENGIIDLLSMEATLSTSLPLSQRLRVSSSVAHFLRSQGEDPQPQPFTLAGYKNMRHAGIVAPTTTREHQMSEQGTRGSLEKPTSPMSVNDDTSFSVAHTRLKVGPDGQVEARPKPGTYSVLAPRLRNFGAKDSKSTNSNMDIPAAPSSMSTGSIQKHLTEGRVDSARQAASYSDDEQDSRKNHDRYMVAASSDDDGGSSASPSLQPPPESLLPRHSVDGTHIQDSSSFAETETYLDDWLNRAMKSTSGDQRENATAYLSPNGMIHHIPIDTNSEITRGNTGSSRYDNSSVDESEGAYSSSLLVSLGDEPVDTMSTITTSKTNRLSASGHSPSRKLGTPLNGLEESRHRGREDLDAW